MVVKQSVSSQDSTVTASIESAITVAIPGAPDLSFLKEVVSDKRALEPASTEIESFCAPAAKVWDTLGLAIAFRSTRKAVTDYLVDRGLLDPSKPSPEEHAIDMWKANRQRALFSMLRFSADDGDMIGYIPSGLFKSLGITLEETKSIVKEIAVEMVERNLSRDTEIVAAGASNWMPTAQRAADNMAYSCDRVLDRRYGISEVDRWTDGVPEGYEPNEVQLKFWDIRKDWPSRMERAHYMKPGSVYLVSFDPDTGAARPKTLVCEVTLPPTTPDMAQLVLKTAHEELSEMLTSLPEHCKSALANPTKEPRKRTYAFLRLLDPGDELVNTWNSGFAKCSSPNLSSGFDGYRFSTHLDGTAKESASHPPMNTLRMHPISHIPSSGNRIPLARADTVRLFVYDSHDHRSFTKTLAKRTPKALKINAKTLALGKSAAAKQEQKESKATIDESYTHPDDNSDASFASSSSSDDDEDEKTEVDNDIAKKEPAEPSGPEVVIAHAD